MAAVSPLNELARETHGQDIEFFFIYTRESHPGENVPPHCSYEEKKQRAHQLQTEEQLRVRLLVDGLSGTVHQAFGGRSNMACIVHRDGRLIYRAEWTDIVELRSEIEHLRRWDEWAAAGQRFRTSYIEKVHAWFEDEETHAVRERTYRRAGEQAVRDFVAKTGRSPL